MPLSNHYTTLQVKQDATPEAIVQAYKQLALKIHPDKNNSPDATQAFQKLLEAYETLKDPQKRAIHDAALLAQQERQRRYARPPYGNPTWAYREAQEAKRSRERAEAECAARAARDRAEAEERYRDSCAAREAHEKKQQLHRERQALWKAEHAKAHAFRQRYEAQKAEIGEANAFFKKQWQQHQRVERERGKKEGKTKRKKAERCPKAEPRMWGGTGEGWRTRGEWERGQ